MEKIDSLNIYVPSAPGELPNEPFDWSVFIRDAFLGVAAKIEAMGGGSGTGTAILSAKSYVDGSSILDWTTLKTDALANGGYIFFPAGTYKINSAIDLDSNMMLFGSDGAVIDASGAIAVTQMVSVDTKSNISIIGLTFKGGANGNGDCVTSGITMVGECTDIRILNCEFQELGDTGIVVDASSCVTPYEGSIWIRDCKFENCNGDGILVLEAFNVSIAGCEIARDVTFTASSVSTILGRGHGIEIKRGRGTNRQNIKVIETTITGARRNGVYVQHNNASDVAPINLTIDNNGFIGGGTDDATTRESANLYLRGSGVWIQDFKNAGISNVDITNNIVVGVIGHGIYVGGGTTYTNISDNDINVSIQGDAVTGDGERGIYINGGTNNVVGARVEGNQIYMNRTAVGTGKAPGSITLKSCLNSVVCANTIRQGVVGIHMDACTGGSVTGNSFYKGSSSGTLVGVSLLTATKMSINGNDGSDMTTVVKEGTGCASNTIVGNNGDITLAGTGSMQGLNVVTTGDALNIAGKFGINSEGFITNGNYVRRVRIPATEMYGETAVLNHASWGYMQVIECDTTLGTDDNNATGLIPVDNILLEDDGNPSKIYVDVWVLFDADDDTKKAAFDLTYYLAKSTDYTTVASATVTKDVTESTDVAKLRYEIPQSTGLDQYGLMKLTFKRTPGDARDTSSAKMYILGAEVVIRSTIDGDSYAD